MPTVTLSTLQGYVLDRLDGNTSAFTNAQITGALNEFIRIANAHIGFIQGTATTTTSTGLSNVYSTPAGILYPLQVSVAGVQLWKMSMTSLANQFPAWATDTTAQFGPIQRWAPIGINSFVLHPNDSIGGRTITVQGVLEPTLLVSGTDTLQLEDAFIQMAVEYAAHRVQLKLGGSAFANASLMIRKFWSVMKDRNNLQIAKMPKYWILEGPMKGGGTTA